RLRRCATGRADRRRRLRPEVVPAVRGRPGRAAARLRRAGGTARADRGVPDRLRLGWVARRAGGSTPAPGAGDRRGGPARGTGRPAAGDLAGRRPARSLAGRPGGAAHPPATGPEPRHRPPSPEPVGVRARRPRKIVVPGIVVPGRRTGVVVAALQSGRLRRWTASGRG